MSQNKSTSHPIFVLTLAVYLGLVLAGGASPALAQAAMAKGFDLKVEQEFKDDLDKKPDDAEDLTELSDAFEKYLEVHTDLIETLQELQRAGKFDLSKDAFSLTPQYRIPCGVSGSSLPLDEIYTPYGFTKSKRQIIIRSIEKSVDNAILSALDLGRFASCGGNFDPERKNANFETSLGYNKAGFKAKAVFKKDSPKLAAQMVGNLLIAFQNFQADKYHSTKKSLAENTSIFSENDQVFIITNLPRAGLDALLAVK